MLSDKYKEKINVLSAEQKSYSKMSVRVYQAKWANALLLSAIL
ncbi:MAG: hypothetical protein US04_C0001G0716 [Candidatus Nomurabacteria bacterium GW2011_GWD2_36_14]|nr:MAG: hypothetical protein US04_C0001G0716 [Candidatus Nomurabacteria bacterium GW2011_GWD2_36_14]